MNENVDEKGLGRHIAVARKQVGRSQQEVADAIGISRSSLAQIELGNRSVTALELAKLSWVLRFALEDIISPGFGEGWKSSGPMQPSSEFATQAGIEPSYGPRTSSASRISMEEVSEATKLDAHSIEKLTNLILYILSKCAGKPNVGEEVLCGLLFFTDHRHRDIYGVPITGITYVQTARGPKPDGIGDVLRLMVDRNLLGSYTGTYSGRTLTRLIPNADYDSTLFKVSEIEVVDSVISSIGWMNAAQISAYASRETVAAK
jgi:transcriptional regulator with XRE-family HTH domain